MQIISNPNLGKQPTSVENGASIYKFLIGWKWMGSTLQTLGTFAIVVVVVFVVHLSFIYNWNLHF